MDMSPSVSILLDETKINNVDLVAMRTYTDQKIGKLVVLVNEVGRVDVFYT
jgi:hypothetical protein